ncbi:MAG: type I restriction enzyme HsdR N-terminal domain-containing protein [Nitrospinae bacterium]|nr:type I restriction enzyme HsdR N-terminal domain-containing protein [Nitrospinota bacterium]MBL7019242.1 type I restriction enzyme HsdR N-terminal domain-containing protein [Nitrospinaceae bacterium]
MFEPIEFENLNEADIREEVIAPLLKELGYRSGSENNIIREQSLKYPRKFLGRKKPNKDPLLRGVADYICVAGGKVQWVIEAKPPGVDLDSNDIEQAYTYACHPEIRAIYFCVCNGKELRIYQTSQSPDTPPIQCFLYEDFSNILGVIRGILGPEAILRDFPKQEPDIEEPIGPGLRSIVRIANGKIVYRSNTLNNPAFEGMVIGITGQAVERNEDGQLVALLKTQSAHESFQKYNEKHGLDIFEAISTDRVVSTNKSKPTVFTNENHVIFPAGEKLLDMTTWKYIELPCNINCKTKTIAKGFLTGNRFEGEFDVEMFYVEQGLNVGMKGDFMIELA